MGGATSTDTLVGIENVSTDAGNDVLIGDDGPNWLMSFGGNDQLAGNGGDDMFTVAPGQKMTSAQLFAIAIRNPPVSLNRRRGIVTGRGHGS